MASFGRVLRRRPRRTWNASRNANVPRRVGSDGVGYGVIVSDFLDRRDSILTPHVNIRRASHASSGAKRVDEFQPCGCSVLGGKDNGPPGFREKQSTYRVLRGVCQSIADGNNIEAVFRGA